MENRVAGPIRDKSPCMDCPEREPGCHDRCREYQAWRQKIVAANEKEGNTRSSPSAELHRRSIWLSVK